MRVWRSFRRPFGFGLSLLLFPFAACDCDGLDNAAPQGVIEPATYDLGPVPLGTKCQAVLNVVNVGRADLQVESASLVDKDGEFEILFVPQFVGLGGVGELTVAYTSTGPENERQSATVELKTNAPRNGGILSAVVTALPTNAAAPVAESGCEVEGELQTPCPGLDFGATPKGQAGRVLPVRIINQGNAPLSVQAAVIDGGDGDFQVEDLYFVSTVVHTPVSVAPSRAEPCGEPREPSCIKPDNCHVLSIDVRYAPSSIGADTATLVVLSDAAENAEIRIPLTGFGSDIGLLLTPNFVGFGGVSQGQTGEQDVVVSNIGTDEAPVNNTCIDLGGDGSCDGNCTGGEPVLEGALECEVFTSDGAHEGKGFVLAPTDAKPGGDDERTIRVTWTPTVGNATIPAGTTLRVESGILGNRVYEAPIVGGAAGVLGLNTDSPCNADLPEICVQAQGDAGDVSTWTGEATLVLRNVGDATLNITRLQWDPDTAETISDDYEILDGDGQPVDFQSPSVTLAPGAEISYTVSYANSPGDASGADIADLLIHHTGVASPFLVTLRVLPPSE